MSTPVLYPGQTKKFRAKALAADGVTEVDYRSVPYWKIDREELLEFVQKAPDGSWVEVRAKVGGTTQELVTLSVVHDLKDGPGFNNSGDSMEIYVKSRPGAMQTKIVEMT